jgi:HEAT repeat protein
MSPRASRWPRSPIVALLLVSCGGAPCPQPVDGSASEVDRLVPVVSNPAAPPAQRAEAVHGLGCMVASLRRGHSSPTLAVLTLGISELFAADVPDLPPDRLPPVVEALGRVFCDPSREVSAAAERELVEMRAPVAAPALVRAARSCNGPRAVAAVEMVEDRTLDYLKFMRGTGGEGHDPEWSALPAWGTAVKDLAGSDRPEVRGRALAAQAKIGVVLDAMALDRARAPEPETLSRAIALHGMPLYGPALERAVPAFRARLADPDPRVRMAAARVVWRLEGSSAASLDRLAKGLRAGGPAPAGEPLDGVKLKGMLPYHLGGGSQFDIEQELTRLAHGGPRAAQAVDAIRACLALEDLKAHDTHRVAAAALALVTGDRGVLPDLQGDNTKDTLAHGIHGDLVAQAILLLEPDDPDARAALGLEPGPLLAAVTRKALKDEEVDWLWWIAILQQREASGPPRAP